MNTTTTTPQAALLSAQNPLLKRCYTMSESHLSGYRVVIGFERLEDAQDAHEYIAKLQATQEPVQAGELPPLPLPNDHNGYGRCPARYTTDQMYSYARAALSARKPLTDETFVAACNGCPTPGKCKDTSGCASAGMNVPTYYVRHPDDTYTAADPQPRFNGIGLEVKP